MSRQIIRDLRGKHDIYIAEYDSDLKTCIPIASPIIQDGIKDCLALPYQNATRYARVFRVLKGVHTSQTVNWTALMDGIERYVGQTIDFSELTRLLRSIPERTQKELDETIKFMAGLALELNEDNFERIPLLTTGSDRSITMSQRQAAILIANGFFCTFEDSHRYRLEKYNIFNFLNLFSAQTHKAGEKLKCIFAYFNAIRENMPNGTITILRQTCPFIRFEEFSPSFSEIKTEETGFIEAQAGEAHVDFANNFIGGGVLRHGTVQEEIRFIIAPETLVSCLLCEQMNKNEAILILGTQQYSNYTGYRNYFKYVPRDTSKEVFTRNSFGHYSSCIIAIDAIRYTKPERQFIRALIDREIRKAYVGFAVKLPDELSIIATGNWGCGAFNGNLQLKFLIQLIAASAAGRNLHYFTFGEKKLIEQIRWFLDKLEDQNVSFNLLYKRMIEGRDRPHGDFILHPFEYLIERSRSTATSPMDVDIPVIDNQSGNFRSPIYKKSKTTDDVSNSMEVDNASSLWKGTGRLATTDDDSPLWIGNGKVSVNDEPSTSNESLVKTNDPISESRSKTEEPKQSSSINGTPNDSRKASIQTTLDSFIIKKSKSTDV